MALAPTAFRAIKDAGYPVSGQSTRWSVEEKRWYGWCLISHHYGDEDSVKKLLGDLACPQIITVRVPDNGE